MSSSFRNRYQVKAIIEVMQRQHWKYASVVYAADSYGENAYSQLRSLFSKQSFCFAAVHRLTTTTTLKSYERLVIILTERSKKCGWLKSLLRQPVYKLILNKLTNYTVFLRCE